MQLRHHREETSVLVWSCSISTGWSSISTSRQQQCTCSWAPGKDWHNREILRSTCKSVDCLERCLSRMMLLQSLFCLQMKNTCLPSVVLKERLSHVRFEKLSQVRCVASCKAWPHETSTIFCYVPKLPAMTTWTWCSLNVRLNSECQTTTPPHLPALPAAVQQAPTIACCN